MLPISLSGLHLVKTFAVIIFLPNRCFAQEVDPVPPNNIAINGAYITLYQYASRGLKIGRHTCPSLLQCAHLCVKSPNCFSFNYQVSAPRNALCELSNESITSSEEQETLKKMPGFVFVQIMRKDLVSFRFVLIFVSFFFLSICLFNIKDWNQARQLVTEVAVAKLSYLCNLYFLSSRAGKEILAIILLNIKLIYKTKSASARKERKCMDLSQMFI